MLPVRVGAGIGCFPSFFLNNNIIMAHKSKKQLSSEMSYIKTICRVQREEIGFQPTLTHRNHKKYNRAESKREMREALCF